MDGVPHPVLPAKSTPLKLKMQAPQASEYREQSSLKRHLSARWLRNSLVHSRPFCREAVLYSGTNLVLGQGRVIYSNSDVS